MKRIEYNLKELAGMTHSPDVARQLAEDFAVVKVAALSKPMTADDGTGPRRSKPAKEAT